MRCNEISRRDEMRLVILRVMSELTSREKPATAPTGEPTCRWEYESGQPCTRSPARGRGGGPRPGHTPLTPGGSRARPAGAEDADPQAGRAPVTEAVRTAGNTLDRVEQLAAALRETAEHPAEALATATHP